jgi:hypothetical protein
VSIRLERSRKAFGTSQRGHDHGSLKGAHVWDYANGMDLPVRSPLGVEALEHRHTQFGASMAFLCHESRTILVGS